ncbi:unnamed protein product [Toxocara canis]|uniref:MTP_lip_bd domain-containing protein n=1 Tax=Toxocara canis TaxID=6265 RepID=A0A183V3R0_TOXCA|nr:unnamed protein product [Toxocara canis]
MVCSDVFANALGSSGTLTTHRFAREILLVEKPQLAEKYLQSLALTAKINEAVVGDLQKWLTEEIKMSSKKIGMESNENMPEDEAEEDNDRKVKHGDELKMHIAFALANLLRRHCESSTTRLHACNEGKDKDVDGFFTSITTCSDTDCHRNALEILTNLPIAGVVPYASQFLCSQDNASYTLQKSALRLLSHVDQKFIDKPIITRLLRIFQDACPLPQSTTDQTLATDVLMNAIPEHATVGTFLLRSESLQPDNHEKWAYFYDSVAQRRLTIEKVDDYWARMRRFRVFRPNYLHRSLNALSNVFGIKIAEKGNYCVQSLTKTEFNGGFFKRSDFLLSVVQSNKRHFPLLGITTDTAGLAEYIAESDSYDERSAAFETPKATVQLNFFNARLPPITVFEGYTGLLSAIWNADGSMTEAHDTNIIWRQFINVIPLLSGITLTSDIIGSASFRLSGSSQISLWNRASSSSFVTNVSASLDSVLTLWTPTGVIGEMAPRLSASGSVVLHLDVDFYSEPYLFCTVVSQGPLRLRQSTSYVTGSGTRRGLSSIITSPGRSFALNERTTRMCNKMLQHV